MLPAGVCACMSLVLLPRRLAIAFNAVALHLAKLVLHET
jgi:hypothetical protein